MADKNIFEDAHFGDKYILRNGEIAIYWCINPQLKERSHYLIIPGYNLIVRPDGHFDPFDDKQESQYDVIRKYNKDTTCNLCKREHKTKFIERAVTWIEKYLGEIGYPDDWLRDSTNIKNGRTRFIKDMENLNDNNE